MQPQERNYGTTVSSFLRESDLALEARSDPRRCKIPTGLSPIEAPWHWFPRNLQNRCLPTEMPAIRFVKAVLAAEG